MHSVTMVITVVTNDYLLLCNLIRCDALWFGTNCSKFICDHKTNPCKNGADCQPLANYKDYRCLCDDAHRGKHCEINNFSCTNTLCGIHGKCTENSTHPSGYRCDCDLGFTGRNCETNINDCEGVNCNNGTCVDGVNNYTCECFVKYTGRHCEYPNYCAIHSAAQSHGCYDGICCANNGTCYNNFTLHKHECMCIPPWISVYNCRRRYDPCAYGLCQDNEICTSDGLKYSCQCITEPCELCQSSIC